MFNLFSKKDEPIFTYNQAVIVEIDFAGLENFGVKEQRKEVYQLEKKIEGVLPKTSGIDGDEFGDGGATIYIYGSNADEIFKASETTLRGTTFNHIDITLQYGLPDDPNTKDKKFTL